MTAEERKKFHRDKKLNKTQLAGNRQFCRESHSDDGRKSKKPISSNMNRIGCNNRIKLYTIHSALRTSLVVACRGSTNAYPSHERVRLHDTVGRELNRWLTLSASIKIARLREWNGNTGERPWGQGASRQPPVGNTHPTAFLGASKNGCGEKRKSTDAIRD